MDLMLSIPGRSYKLPVTVIPEDGRLRLKYGFCREMNDEVKAMSGAKYHGYDNPDKKYWTVADCQRNWFTLRYLAGEDVFANFDAPVIPLDEKLYSKAYPHQLTGAAEVLARRRQILAWEMGTCKTYTVILAMENSKTKDWWWIGTKGSLREMSREFIKWQSKVTPVFMTYDELKKVINNWPKDKKSPKGVVFDEFSRAKNHTSQRGEACYKLAEGMRSDWGDEAFIIGMTGTPQPNTACDWWHLCEVVAPGFIREGSVASFKKRLSLTVSKQGEYGVYPELITWWDNELKCKTCGQFEKNNPAHDTENSVISGIEYHKFEKSKNEIANLYNRMKGLVTIKFKKDVLKFLPEKRYHTEILKPSDSVLRAAKTILKTAKSTIIGLTLLRELSDGFQYVDVPDGIQPCETCTATGQIIEYYKSDDPDCCVHSLEAVTWDTFDKRNRECPACEGKKVVPKYRRDTKEIPCPKDDYFDDLLENHEDCGRFIVFAGFTGSIDRCCNRARRNGWSVIRIDSRGWLATDYNGVVIPVKDLYNKDKGDPYLQMFQDDKVNHPRVVIIGHPASGGMGLTLTASPGLFWYGLVFNGEDYMQACDRGHRPGMDLNRGFTIYHAIHLPTDQLQLDSLNKKIDMQNMSLGVFKDVLEGERTV